MVFEATQALAALFLGGSEGLAMAFEDQIQRWLLLGLEEQYQGKSTRGQEEREVQQNDVAFVFGHRNRGAHETGKGKKKRQKGKQEQNREFQKSMAREIWVY